MQMWMVWLIWGAFLMVLFGLIADAVSVSKGYARSWFYAGLFLGPFAILILLLRPDPRDQVRYIDLRKPMDQQIPGAKNPSPQDPALQNQNEN